MPLAKSSHYIRLHLSPAGRDPLSVRKSIQDALAQSFGATSAGTYLDILWISDDGEECVIRVDRSDTARVLAAAMASSAPGQMFTLVKESSFLPAVTNLSEPL
ncbi:hypothetical protein FISHEDRAFT_43010 [Fistulina hepatica ATCC 64428]|uniref:Ribonucleases P/MRP subunit Pop8-like domain-containing protein n=1 Tax=Fistulina hepatica ATCC 64428 TaxID=1128425 RepID=A0A0D7ACI4_9AGAR|nr:hypothetical protein FISHEDRAFT_43010 [Fistulina hepatica ATCC 64428]